MKTQFKRDLTKQFFDENFVVEDQQISSTFFWSVLSISFQLKKEVEKSHLIPTTQKTLQIQRKVKWLNKCKA